MTADGTLDASASDSVSAAPAGGGQAGYTEASAYAAFVALDGREVSISSGIEPSFHKQINNGAVSQTPNARNADGSIWVDSVLQWHNYAFGLGGGYEQGWQVNGEILTANVPNFNSPSCSWTSSGSGTLTPVTGNQASYSLLSPDGKNLPLNTSFTVKVTDSDGAVGANTYTVTWHLPYEPTQLVSTTHTKSVGETRVGPVAPGETTLVQPSSPQKVDVSAIFDTGEAVSAAAGQDEAAGLFKIAASIASITNVEYDYGGEASYNGAANTPGSGNWSLAIGDMNEIYQGPPNISPASLASDPNGQELCYLYIKVVEKETDRVWDADGYNAHGYDSDSNHTIKVHQCDLIESQPFFVQYKNHDGSGYVPSTS